MSLDESLGRLEAAGAVAAGLAENPEEEVRLATLSVAVQQIAEAVAAALRDIEKRIPKR
jgi:hypothetical protein